MGIKRIEFDSPESKLNIKQNWLKINDEHLNAISNQDDLTHVIEDLYQLDHHFVEKQIQDWINNQINIDGHTYQTRFSLIN